MSAKYVLAAALLGMLFGVGVAYAAFLFVGDPGPFAAPLIALIVSYFSGMGLLLFFDRIRP